MFLVVNGVPSIGTMAIVGSGQIETQPQLDVASLPPSVNSTVNPSSTGPSGGNGNREGVLQSHLGLYIGLAAGGAASIFIAAGLILLCIKRRNARAQAVADAAALGRQQQDIKGGGTVPLDSYYGDIFGESDIHMHTYEHDYEEYNGPGSGSRNGFSRPSSWGHGSAVDLIAADARPTVTHDGRYHMDTRDDYE